MPEQTWRIKICSQVNMTKEQLPLLQMRNRKDWSTSNLTSDGTNQNKPFHNAMYELVNSRHTLSPWKPTLTNIHIQYVEISFRHLDFRLQYLVKNRIPKITLQLNDI